MRALPDLSKSMQVEKWAPVAELVDAPDLGSGAARRECSSHFRGTIKNSKYFIRLSHFYKFALLN